MGRPATDIRERIVRSARQRFLAEGVDGASMRAIAKGASTSLGMITYYFTSKDELFLAVLEDFYGKLLVDLEAVLAPGPPAIDRLRGALARLSGASDVELEVVRLIAREALVSSSRLEKVMARFSRGHLPMVMDVLRAAKEEGLIDDDLPLGAVMLATFALGGVVPLVRRTIGDRVPIAQVPKGDRLSALLIDILFRGIGPRQLPNGATPPAPERSPKKTKGAPRRNA